MLLFRVNLVRGGESAYRNVRKKKKKQHIKGRMKRRKEIERRENVEEEIRVADMFNINLKLSGGHVENCCDDKCRKLKQCE